MAVGGKPKSEPGEEATRRHNGHRERLWRRVLKGDGAHLADFERLGLRLCAFIPRVDMKPIAKELIARFGTVSAVLGVPPKRLMEVKGVGEAAAACLRATHFLMQQAACVLSSIGSSSRTGQRCSTLGD